MTPSRFETCVEVGNLPLWMGVQDKPGAIPLPFAFGIEQGLIRLAVDPEIRDRVTKHYGDTDYNFITSPPGTSDWGNQLGDMYFEHLARTVGSLNGKTVLEIGSGTLHIAKRVVSELGARKLIACDPALKSEDSTKSIEVAREYFTKGSFPGATLDAVLSINNLEHIPNPFEYLTTVRALLENNSGFLFVIVPDCERSLRSGDVGICLHEHLSYFTESSLRFVLARCGFSIDSLHKQDDALFAVARPGPISTPNFRSQESLLGEFKARMTASLEHARGMIDLHRNSGRVAIHGCSVGLNNILHLLKIRNIEGFHLFDGDTRKANRYLGAYDLPILSSEDERYKTMRTVLVSAPTYFEPIKRFALGKGIPPDRILPLTPI